ncbi:hypothetical protein F5X96DRAFT_637871 [Biscogniauxia mediterranea]|nr:hypothetical protein F5X96DRAFT_637871 [Biscogniauxia mediterranea]
MATLDSLKLALRQKAKTSTSTASSPNQPLSDTQYSVGFDILKTGSGWTTYEDFIIPQLSQLLSSPLLNSHTHISVLEIGPGPKSVLGYLPSHLRRKINRYAAFEPNGLFATSLEEWLCSTSQTEVPMPCLASPPNIYRIPFSLADSYTSDGDDKFDLILFCHSMYGLNPKPKFIERALEMLVKQPESGMVVVFHRNGALRLGDLVCHRTASFPTGLISVADNDDVLDQFAHFIAGFVMQDADMDKAIRVEWRKVCRALGRRETSCPDHLLFSEPNIMMAFTRNATRLPELTALVPLVKGAMTIKNREARLHRPASIVRPTEVRHVQECVRWALEHEVGLTVIGGGHSGHCLWPNVVSVDMSAFDQVHIHTAVEDEERSGPLVVAETGCKTGDIIRKTMSAGLTVPLGSRPSVGAGLWLQGGMGHLSRLHGLACDAIVGAVVVSVDSGQVFYIGCVPSQYRPSGAVCPENETDILWALKGAGTNFGIVISVTFKAHAAPTYLVRNWVTPLRDDLDAWFKLNSFNELVAKVLPRDSSADVYLYWDTDQLHLSVTMYEPATTGITSEILAPASLCIIMGPEYTSRAVDGLGLFETAMYMSGMHGGHAGGKTSSFKRCLFLKNIGAANVTNSLVTAVRTCPSPLCYLHLLQGGGAIGDVAADASAFGCRDWDFACVVTGVWPRDQDETETARAAVQWVYDVAGDMLPLSSGVYGADLGPDPRDAALAAKAFGPNLPRLARLKDNLDPRNVLAYACPLPKVPAPACPFPELSKKHKLIILVTGEHGAGKDYCADVWVSVFTTCTNKSLTARLISISDETKREYAAATNADIDRLLCDRTYKEQHRLALTNFFQEQVRRRPQLLEEHFLKAVDNARDVDVLLITGMRDDAPVAAFSHLVPDDRLLEVRVEANQETRQVRRGGHGRVGDHGGANKDEKGSNNGRSNPTALGYRPSLVFHNETNGNDEAKRFAERYLLPFCNEDLEKLAGMVRLVPDFPLPGTNFRHVLDVAQQPGGLKLCTDLLEAHSAIGWAEVDAVACCEAGGFIFASALATRVGIPLALIREAGKLPPPTVSTTKSSSHISSLAPDDSKEKRIEMNRDAVPRGGLVVVVDDVLATGTTLCAVLHLLVDEAGISPKDIGVMVIAEFPAHRGRKRLLEHGFGEVHIQSLLVYGGY